MVYKGSAQPYYKNDFGTHKLPKKINNKKIVETNRWNDLRKKKKIQPCPLRKSRDSLMDLMKPCRLYCTH